jgi:hypothetical protein
MKKEKLAILKEIYRDVAKYGNISKAIRLRQQLVKQLKPKLQ